MALSNKKRKWILRNHPDLSLAEMARELGVREREVLAVLEAEGKAAPPQDAAAAAAFRPKFAKVQPLAMLLIVLIVGVGYLHCLQNDFHYDDIHSLKDNLDIRKLENLPKYFNHPEMFSARPSVAMPRPLLLVTFALNYAWTQYHPWSWLLVNYLMHLANVLIVYLAICHLLGDRRAAWLAALLWGLHPVNTESVNYINCRSELMVSTFMLLTVYFFFRSAQEKRWGHYVAALAALTLGLLTKELAITTPFLVLAFDAIYFFDRSRERWPERLLRRHLPLFLVMFGYLFYRKLTLEGKIPDVHRNAEGMLANLMTQSRVLVYYLKLFLFPVHLNSSYENIDFKRWIEDYVLFCWMALGGLVLLAVWLRRRAAAVSFFVAVFFLVLAPTSSVIRFNAYLNEHRLYLPSLGFTILLVLAALRAADLRPPAGWPAARWRNLVYGLLTVVFACFTALAVQRTFLWKSDMLLWRDAASKAPEKAQVISDLGNAYYREIPPGADPGQHPNLDRAEQLYKWSIRVDPTYYKALHNLGTVAYSKANSLERRQGAPAAKPLFEQAVKYFQDALRVFRSNAETWNDLASTLIRLKRYPEAETAYRKAVELDPELYKAMINLGVVIFYQANDLVKTDSERAKVLFREAINWLEKSTTVYDRDPLAWYYMAQIFFKALNSPQDALRCIERAIQLAPDNLNYQKVRDEIRNPARPPAAP